MYALLAAVDVCNLLPEEAMEQSVPVRRAFVTLIQFEVGGAIEFWAAFVSMSCYRRAGSYAYFSNEIQYPIGAEHG